MLNVNRPQRVLLAVAFAGYALLAVMVVRSTPSLVFDEPGYLSTVPSLEQYGLTAQFLNASPNLAGPLFTVVHWLAQPLTGLQPPGVRFVNVALLGLIVLIQAGLLHHLSTTGTGGAPSESRFASLTMIGIPVTWIFAGMALTEIPSIFCCVTSLYLLCRSLDGVGFANWTHISQAAAGGLLLGLAIVGRQPFLLVLVPLPLLLLWSPRRIVVLTYLAASLPLPAALFATWGGLVPPLARRLLGTATLAPTHVLKGCAVAGIILLIVAPRFLLVGWKTLATVPLAVAAIDLAFGVSAHATELGRAPAMVLVQRFFPAAIQDFYVFAAQVAMNALGVVFLIAVATNIWRRRREAWLVFASLATLLIIAAAAPIPIFATRYPGIAVPFLLIMSARHFEADWWTATRVAAGMAIGVAGLDSYIHAL